MKVVVKSTYVQDDGWGKAARDYLKAFTLTGHNIEVQPIVLSKNVLKSLPDWIPPTAQANNPDVYFQQCLPQYFERFPSVRKHIGSCFTETRHLEQTGWIDHVNEMDVIVVATEQEAANLLESGAKPPIFVIPMPMDFSSLDYDGELTGLASSINRRYAFYFIGELVDRKNIADLLLAYWREFSYEDDVVLVIKTSAPPEALQQIQQWLHGLKNTVRLYDYPHHYPEVFFLLDRFTDEEMVRLHNTCDCFITLSYGESTCRPLIDAAYKGKPVICTGGIGAVDSALAISKVQSYEVPCFTSFPPLANIYTSWETWMKPDIMHAQKLMRDAYNNKLPSSSTVNIKGKFSYESVASRLNDIL